jgi:hypothetical protein
VSASENFLRRVAPGARKLCNTAGMTAPARGIPLIPDRRALDERAMGVLVRSCITAAAGKFEPGTSSRDYARRRWGDDAARSVELLARAASSPATTSTPGWADTLGHIVPTYLRNLVPYSAGADLLTRALMLSFDGARTINLPFVTTPLADFVGEQAPVPIVDGTSALQATIVPYKFAVIVVLTNEMVSYSPAETLVRDALLQASGPALDRRLFDQNPLVANVRPAGLLNGIAALTPSSNADPTIAMQSDLETLLAAVAPVAGNSPVVLIAAPAQAVAIGLKTFQSFAYPVLVSNSLAAKTVIAIAVNAVVSASGAAPEIDTTRAASLHMADTPLPLVDSGGFVASPTPSASIPR